ncbi:MAG: hypothetical protein ACREL5_02800 [Gemmatimonadales bacterium]
MNGRNTAGRILVATGSIVLFASVVLHIRGGYSQGFPALAASNLEAGLQAAFRVVFLTVAGHWILLGLIAVVAAFKATAARTAIVLLCGFGILIEAVAGATVVGLFIGNELIGAAAILMIVGGWLLGGVDTRPQ